MNNAITETKSTLEGTNSAITEEEDRISEVEYRMVEINEAEREKELKEMRTTSETFGTMLNTQHSNHRSPRRRRQKEGHEKMLEEIIVENFPKMGKEITTQAQETQRVPNRIDPR